MRKILPDGTIVKEKFLASQEETYVSALWPASDVSPSPLYPNLSAADVVWRQGPSLTRWSYNRISYRNSFKKTFNPCDHVSTNHQRTARMNVSDYSPYYTGVGKYYTYGFLEGTFRGVFIDGETAADRPSFDASDFVARAVRDMAPGIKSEMSALVSLWEIKDVLNLPKALLSLGKSLIGVIPSEKPFREVMRLWGKGQLTYTFGIKQLGADLHAIMNAASRVESALRDLVSRSGKVQVRHYSEPITTKEGHKTKLDYTNWWRQDGSMTTTWRIVNTCTMKYKYRLVDSKGRDVTDPASLSRLDAYLDYLGVKYDPGVIWDVIPFSFVIDWFVGVGDWLSSFSKRNIQPQTEIIDLMWSSKATSSTISACDYFGQRVWSGEAPPLKQDLLGTCTYNHTYKHYVRQRCIPPPSSLVGDSPSLKDFSAWKLGLALVVSRL